MKPSSYNFFYPYKNSGESNKYIAYNALTSSLALIDKVKYDNYMKFAKRGEPINDNEFIEKLRLGGFIIQDNINELDIIKHDMYNAKFDESYLNLTIVPTLDCNFRCIYCYEKNTIRSCSMSNEIADKIIDLIQAQVKSLKGLNVAWYGGEPLLRVEMIEYLSKNIIKLCEENKIRYESTIVTNGYLLNDKNIKLLQNSRITGMQITIDGNEDVHNMRRPLSNGNPTFKEIINNLKLLKKYNQYTSLRINVDKENYKEVFEVIDILTSMGLQKWIMPYLGLVRDYDGCYKSSKCLNVDDFHDLTKKFNIYVSEKGFVTSEDKDQIPQRINCYCGAEKANSLIISADGELFKCWHDVGNNKQSIGNINSGMQKNLTYMSYVMSDPSEMLDCKHCEYLPICFSGCPNDRNMDTNFKCSTYKSNVEDILQYFVEKSQNKKL